MNLKHNLFRAFVSGSSFPAVILFFHGFKSLESKYNLENMKKKLGIVEPYYLYTLTAPIYFGLSSMLSIFISKYYNIYFRYSYFLVSLISPLLVSIFIKYFDVYYFNDERWIKQYLYLYIYHMVNCNLIIANIYYLLSVQ